MFFSLIVFSVVLYSLHYSSLDERVTLCSVPYRTQEKEGLKQSLAASHHTHMSNRGQLEQEALHLKKEVTRLELELANTQKVLKLFCPPETDVLF